MKNIINILLLFIFISCKSQTVYNINNADHFGKSGYYYKDVENLLDKYVGTWQYTNGNTSLKIVFKKQIKYYYVDDNYYIDVLIGEYEYIQNGVLVANYLSRLNDSQIDPASHYLNNGIFMDKYRRPLCSICDDMVKRVKIHFTDPQRKYIFYEAFIGLTEDFPTPKLVLKLYGGGGSIPEGAPDNLRIPLGIYTLNKM